MSNLYNITSAYLEVLDMLYQEDIEEQCVLDTLESIEGELEDKADNYAKIIKQLENHVIARKEEVKRLNKGSKTLENKVILLKNNLFNSMKEIGKTKFATPLFSFNIAKNGGKQALTINGDVPEEYTKVILENDTDKIRKALETGEKLPFAQLEPRGESLRIK